MWIIILIIAAVLIAAILTGLFAAYHRVFYSPVKGAKETDLVDLGATDEQVDIIRNSMLALEKRECEYVTTRAYDGTRLAARYYHTDDDAPLCLCFHGYRGSSLRDFSIMTPFLIEQGYNVIAVDERACWRSGGHTVTFGIRERYDVLSWVNYANERFGSDKPIYIFGISLGGGTVLMASGLDLPENVRSISADCPYNSPKDIICYVSNRLGLSPKWTWPVLWLGALIYGHFNINKTTAAKEVVKTTKPILIIHGADDTFVPAYMSKEVYDANPAMIERHTFPHAEHGVSYSSDPERYKRIVTEFLAKHP